MSNARASLRWCRLFPVSVSAGISSFGFDATLQPADEAGQSGRDVRRELLVALGPDRPMEIVNHGVTVIGIAPQANFHKFIIRIIIMRSAHGAEFA